MIYTGTYFVLVARGLILSVCETTVEADVERAALEKRDPYRSVFGEIHMHKITGRRPVVGNKLYLCCYCGKRIAARGLDIDGGQFAHKACHKEACR